MTLPSLQNAVNLSAATGNKVINLNCMHCKKLLWEVKVNMSHDRVVSTETTAFPGVKPYGEVWQKTFNPETKHQEWICKDTKCPFCLKDYFSALVAEGKFFAKASSVELE